MRPWWGDEDVKVGNDPLPLSDPGGVMKMWKWAMTPYPSQTLVGSWRCECQQWPLTPLRPWWGHVNVGNDLLPLSLSFHCHQTPFLAPSTPTPQQKTNKRRLPPPNTHTKKNPSTTTRTGQTKADLRANTHQQHKLLCTWHTKCQCPFLSHCVSTGSHPARGTLNVSALSYPTVSALGAILHVAH